MILGDLQYIIGAVARKDLEPALCHLTIRGGRATAFGGRLAMSSPIACDLDVRPHARSLVKAVQACDNEAITLAMTAGGRLTVRAGKFRAHVDCLPQDAPVYEIAPAGEYFDVTDDFLDSITTLAPFMSVDASRQWAQGLKIGHHSTYATNNIILAQRWHGAQFPAEVIIPADAVNELIRVKEKPLGVQFNDSSMTFFFANKRWLCTSLLSGDQGGWGNVDRVFDANTDASALEPVPQGFYAALDTLKPFLNDRGLIYMLGDRLATAPEDGEGAALDCPVAQGPIFHAAQLRSLEKVATKVNFAMYPKPCYFVGEKLRGVILGLRA